MKSDITNIKELVENTSLMCLDTWYIMKFCKICILHKDRPTDIDDASISDDPDITVPIKNFMKHDKKYEKQICFKEP